MKQVILQRTKEVKGVNWKNRVEDSTLGELTIIDEDNNLLFKCCTCENGGPSTDTPNQDKRIVARRYVLRQRITGTPIPKKYNKIGVWVQNPEDKKFADRFIMIHIGNGPQDVEGCIALGKSFSSTKGLINSSAVAVTEFYDIINKFGVDNFELIVKEIGQ